jgi:Dyp-type peroxidase family
MSDEQTNFVCCVPIRCDTQWPGVQVRAVEARLKPLGNPALGPTSPGVDPSLVKPLGRALDPTGRIHFMSLSVIWDGTTDDQPYLILDITGDGAPAAIIDILVDAAGPLILPAFEAAQGIESSEALKACLKRCRKMAVSGLPFAMGHATTGLPFQGTPGLSVERIHRDRAISNTAAKVVLNQPGRARRLAPKIYWQNAKAAVLGANLQLKTQQPPKEQERPTDTAGSLWAMFLASRFAQSWVALTLLLAIGMFVWAGMAGKLHLPDGFLADVNYLGEHLVFTISSFLIAFGVAVVTVLVLIGVIALVLAVWLRTSESAETARDLDPDVTIVREIMERENRCGQNHMIGVSTVKPGVLHGWIGLPAAFYVIGLAVKARLFLPGFLSSIGTIHCAQWVRLPGTNKLLFLSNYDGSWQSYLEDFITKANQGLTGIWSNTLDFPKTKWLFEDGATDGERFKRWARRQQIPTPVWYSAYPDLTSGQIRNNAQIRIGLERDPKQITEEDCLEWLDLFGSSPRPDYSIEASDVQSMLLGAQRNLLEGVCVVVNFPKGVSAAKCRAWLSAIAPDPSDPTDPMRVTCDDARPDGQAVFVALTAHGLKRLGLAGVVDPISPGKGPLFSNFPSAFVLGMDSPTRSRVLGDVGANDPVKWSWGNHAHPVHAVLLIYADDEARLKAVEDRHQKLLADNKLAQAWRIRMKRLPDVGQPIREPFGFVDGISQPAIRGVRSSRSALTDDLVEPGEFILGYRDGRQQFPPTPQIEKSHDVAGRLPDLPKDFPPSAGREHDVRDLGQNGSYLVIRQLEQNVTKFNDFLTKGASQLTDPHTDEEWLAAKMVGRWRKNGAPLVAYPNGPPPSYDTKQESPLLFGKQDPQGLACPFGAHIRRANPRDNFDGTDEEQIGLTNRHRLLRRGRPYVPANNSSADGAGLVFMCLNADIERQFEFVQQTWVGSKSFSGLVNEDDPVVGAGDTFTIPTEHGPVRVHGLQQFVTVVGGAYFFLPGARALDFLCNLRPPAAPAAPSAPAATVATPPPSPLAPQPTEPVS